MAIDLTLKSVQITNREASPAVLNSPSGGGAGRVEEVFGHIASVTASLSITSIIRLCSVPSNARIGSVKLYSEAQGAGAFDVGLYQTNDNGGAVVDKDLFGSAVSCASAVTGTEILQESAEFALAEMAKPVWEVIGLTADSHRDYDVCAVVTTTDVTTGTGALGVRVQYVR